MSMGTVITRTFELICVVIALVCVGIGKGICHPDLGCNEKIFGFVPEYPISQWNRGGLIPVHQYIYGQYWVFASTLLLGVMTVVSLIFACGGNKLALQTAPFGSFVSALNGGLEVWYTLDGFGHMSGYSSNDTGVYVQSWAAAAAFFFILLVVYIIDSAIEYRGH